MFRIACLAILAAPAVAAAQHHGGGGHPGGHPGGMSSSGFHGGVGAPGYRGGIGAPGYHGSLNNYGYRGGYSTFGNYGVPYYGGFGYPYGYGYGGIGLGYGVGGLGYGYGMGSAYGYNSSFGYRDRYVPLPGPGVVGPQTIPIDPVQSFTKPAPAVVDLVVPSGAKVWFDDKEAEVKDGQTTYTSPILEPGRGPTLHLKATWDGRDRDMYLTLRAGDKMTVDLRKN